MAQNIHKILTLTDDKKEISFELNKSNIILIVKEIIGANFNSEYKETFTFEALKNINNYYSFFDNIKEIYEDIVNHLEKKEYNIIKENNILSLIIKSKVGIKEIEISLTCKKNINNEIKDENISYNKNENIDEIKTLKEKLNSLKNDTNKILEILNSKLNANLEKENYFDKPSLICTQKNEIDFIKSLLPNKNLILIYRATIDGDSFSTFHSKCDNQGESLTLFETKDARKFGGHMNKSISTQNNWFNKNDENFFCSVLIN